MFLAICKQYIGKEGVYMCALKYNVAENEWEEIEDDYEYVSSTSMLIWTFYANNTATERITLEMNGITMVDKTLHFSYEYKGSTIKLTSESGNISEYEISVSGNTMRLGNQEDGYFNLKKM